MTSKKLRTSSCTYCILIFLFTLYPHHAPFATQAELLPSIFIWCPVRVDSFGLTPPPPLHEWDWMTLQSMRIGELAPKGKNDQRKGRIISEGEELSAKGRNLQRRGRIISEWEELSAKGKNYQRRGRIRSEREQLAAKGIVTSLFSIT
jgi:hypothetical protein